jgi:hypothetical protein
MINLTSYRDHDLNEDPMVFLPCGHFFATSSMDGILEIHKVYQKDPNSDAFVGLISRGNDVNEKSKQCPECRGIIHSVRRYGRLLRLIELRSLERKHMAMMGQALMINEKRISSLASRPPVPTVAAKERKGMLDHLEKVEREIRRSPMNRIFEACVCNCKASANLVEAVAPPTSQLIRCLELRALVSEHWAGQFDDINFLGAKIAYLDAIEIADSSTSRRSGAKLRLDLARLYLKYCQSVDNIRDEVNGWLDWILTHSGLHDSHEIVRDAKALKQKLREQNDLETIRSVMSAMSQIQGYNYGGSASDHWYECPNGHPYFIGECGQAMQESRCPECGAPVGGGSHRLRGDNRRIGGMFRDALNG